MWLQTQMGNWCCIDTNHISDDEERSYTSAVPSKPNPFSWLTRPKDPPVMTFTDDYGNVTTVF